jgi:hypothetical protein
MTTSYNSGTPGVFPNPGDGSAVTVIKTGGTVATSLADWTALIVSTLRGTGTLGTAQILAGATATQNITVTGAVVGSEVAVGGPSTLEAGLLLYAYVSATNTVTLRVANNTAGNITPAAAQTFSVRVFLA